MDELNESKSTLATSLKSNEEKLTASEHQLTEAKKLNTELQGRISELIQNSGDNSAQLSTLNENLKQREMLETIKCQNK